MSEDDLTAYNNAQDIPEIVDDGYVTEEDSNPMDINTVLDGFRELNFSHAGGEFQDIMEAELHNQQRCFFF
jgi:hypothetical protein